MIVISNLMAMAMIGVHHINDVFMGVAVFFNLGVMFRDDLCEFREIMGDRTGVRRQEHSYRQSDGQQSSQISRDLPCHSTCSCGSWPTCVIPREGYICDMTKHPSHATHPAIIEWLKRANGHLAIVIKMIEDEQPCTDIAPQLHAVENAAQQVKRTLIQDHIDQCLDDALVGYGVSTVAAEFRAITKYL